MVKTLLTGSLQRITINRQLPKWAPERENRGKGKITEQFENYYYLKKSLQTLNQFLNHQFAKVLKTFSRTSDIRPIIDEEVLNNN